MTSLPTILRSGRAVTAANWSASHEGICFLNLPSDTIYSTALIIFASLTQETAVQTWDANQPDSARLSLEQATTIAQETTYL
jgi:hypothetical protein